MVRVSRPLYLSPSDLLLLEQSGMEPLRKVIIEYEGEFPSQDSMERAKALISINEVVLLLLTNADVMV